MNIATIAEWVEDETLLNAIEALGIDYGQGFGIQKPELIPMPKAFKQKIEDSQENVDAVPDLKSVGNV